MAEGKKSFILYCDLIHQIEHLTNEEKGVLFQHLLEYVNDMNPVLEDRVLIGVWKPIEMQLKRDLKKYESYIEKQRLNGAKGGRPKKTQKTQPFLEKPKKPDNDTVNDNDTVSTKVDSTDLVETTEEIRNINVDYVQLFLKQWNETRTTILKKPSNINRLGYDERDEVYEIYKAYDYKQVHTALNGLFRQKTLPHGNTSILTSPKHFINNFERYYQAGVDMNPQLYGTNE